MTAAAPEEKFNSTAKDIQSDEKTATDRYLHI
jgi:hypothetical protein